MKETKKADRVFDLLIMPIVIFIVLTLIQHADGLLPATAVGAAGLMQVRRYCMFFLLSHLLLLLPGIPLLFRLYMLIYRAVNHRFPFSGKAWAAVSILAAAVCLFTFPYHFRYAQQADANGYSSHPLIQAGILWQAVNKDLQQPESRAETGVIEVKASGIYAQDGCFLSQISAQDEQTLSQGIFPYLPHRIETYRCSGLIKSIDGTESAEQPATVIKLTYDEDAGILRRELLCTDEEMLPDLHLQITADGEPEIGQRINGRTEIDFKPMFPGYYELWVELWGKPYSAEVISNVIEFEMKGTDK